MQLEPGVLHSVAIVNIIEIHKYLISQIFSKVHSNSRYFLKFTLILVYKQKSRRLCGNNSTYDKDGTL
jgi:hypothetical protein